MHTRSDYELLVYTLPSRYPAICLSTLVLTPPGLDTARLTGNEITLYPNTTGRYR